MAKAAMVGYTGCVMCYGQTGAGKTFTLANETAGQQGIMVQTFNLIFQTAAEDKHAKSNPNPNPTPNPDPNPNLKP